MHPTTRVLTTAVAGTLLATAYAAATPPVAAVAAPHASAAHADARAVHRVSPPIRGRHRRHAGAAQQSLNWSGYVRAGHGYTSATGSWTVPTVASTHDGYSSTWVGIDGAASGDRYLIQTGTEADVVNGRRSYRAWWEVITPTDVAPETVFSGLTVRPGDSITASVRRTSPGRWTMQLSDATTHRSASHSAAFAGPGSSVEWIQEDTDVDDAISSAPNWGSVAFRRLTLDGGNPRLTASEAVDIVDAHGTRETSTGSPTSSGSGFTVRWLATGSPSPAP